MGEEKNIYTFYHFSIVISPYYSATICSNHLDQQFEVLLVSPLTTDFLNYFFKFFNFILKNLFIYF